MKTLLTKLFSALILMTAIQAPAHSQTVFVQMYGQTESGCNVGPGSVEIYYSSPTIRTSNSDFGFGGINNVISGASSETVDFQCSTGSSVSISMDNGGIDDLTIGALPAQIVYGYRIYTGENPWDGVVAVGRFSDGPATFVSTGEKTNLQVIGVLVSPTGKSFAGQQSFGSIAMLNFSFTD